MFESQPASSSVGIPKDKIEGEIGKACLLRLLQTFYSLCGIVNPVQVCEVLIAE